jgi:hypothetical protein
MLLSSGRLAFVGVAVGTGVGVIRGVGEICGVGDVTLPVRVLAADAVMLR